jgi:Caspase domain
MVRRSILGLALLQAALTMPGPAAAACDLRHDVTLADGSRVCLADLSMASLRPRGRQEALRELVPSSGSYAVAMPGRPGACPAVLGFAWSTSQRWQQAISGMTPEDRATEALRDCRKALVDSGSPADCACKLVVLDGQSSLGAQAFAEATGQATALAAAPAPATVAARPAASAAAADSGSSAADIVALRQQIELLRNQMNQQSAATTPKAAAPAAPKLRARALVVGNGAYGSMGTLANPRNDANAIAAKLRGFGVEVALVLDAGRSALVQALADYQSRGAGYDVDILFYAGHGLQIGGINYIVPVDLPASGATVGSIKLNALSLNDMLEYLSAPTRLVFLDACRDNPLSRSLIASRSSAAGIGLAPVNTISGTLVAYATKDGSTAEDGAGRNSPYTTALLQHLDADEDIAVVLRRVRQAVLKATGSRQEPWEYGSLIGDQLVLARLSR